jgi:hypothetical protein
MDFEIISEITDIETIAIGSGVRDRARLSKNGKTFAALRYSCRANVWHNSKGGSHD